MSVSGVRKLERRVGWFKFWSGCLNPLRCTYTRGKMGGMTNITPPQKFVRYSIHVDTITAAWAFVMERMDEFVRPTIQVEACTTNSGEGDEWVDGYDASVYGDVTEADAHR